MHYKGKGNHSVHQLETIIETLQEELHQLKICNPNQLKQSTIEQRASAWLLDACGESSKTICSNMLGLSHYGNYPYDSGDFGRCYCLLNLIPEWKSELHKLKPISKQWSNLVDNWASLTEMYENGLKLISEDKNYNHSNVEFKQLSNRIKLLVSE